MVKLVKGICGLISLVVCLPIGVYLQYQILLRVGASDVMWLLFFVGYPLSIFLTVVLKIVEIVADEAPGR